jgi:Putative zinc-finger/PilZ domain
MEDEPLFRESVNKEKRQETRYPTNDSVKVCLPPSQLKHAAKILNVSRHGLQLELNCSLPNRGRVEILTTASVAIIGEIRYCNPTSAVFHVGVLIHDVVFAKPPGSQHINDDQASLYLAGRGLSAVEVLRVKEHLEGCATCSSALAAATLQLIRRKKASLPREP